MRKRTRWTLLVAVAIVLVVGLVAGFSGFMSFRKTEKEIRAHFEARGQALPEFLEIEDGTGRIFVAYKGDLQSPTVVFVHGSPGSWDNFIHMLSDESLNSRYTVAAVDRPGFGRSRPSRAEPSLEIQARRIHDAVTGAGLGLPAIWVGHSLGGPVVARLAVDFPNAARGLVLVAPSMDPELEELKWYNYLAKFPLFRWGLSRAWRNSNDEIFPHRSELELLEKELSEIRCPTIVLQGDRDELVPPGNADYVKRKFLNAPVDLRMLSGANHFIPWTRPEQIKQAVADLQARTQAPAETEPGS
ncbi:alpha/beta hydrolase [Pelagicoccus sp. SDUM812003]|uniref:alpha/beta fold hydrolase n=1 Tax=Pelagicoccus sp. SDUM812003 TaxID=3041267 RepID=UPI00280E0E07|nr:alpha/beta hydrolase [Pelagicoccus sp. SDUM812003]MDQ8202052.1 alpha/beta hydrolase [Pelagicoccus sp. SDUM812003]